MASVVASSGLHLRPYNITFILLAVLSVSCATSLKQPIPPVSNTYCWHEGIKIHFKDVGAGRAVVFLHGFGASLDTWRYMVDALKNEYRLVLLDLKGHGFSDRPHDERYSVQDHARVVMGLINHLGLQNVVMVGHSFGSAVALAVASEAQKSFPGVVAALVLIGGSVDEDNLPFFLRLLRTPLIGWLSVKLTSASFRTRLMLKRAYYDDEKVTDSLVELYAKYQYIPGTDYALMKTAEQIVPSDFLHLKKDLAKLEVPVINIWGEHDEIVPRPSAEGVCSLLPRCAFVTVEEAGHIPPEETPEKIVALLRDFLRIH